MRSYLTPALSDNMTLKTIPSHDASMLGLHADENADWGKEKDENFKIDDVQRQRRPRVDPLTYPIVKGRALPCPRSS